MNVANVTKSYRYMIDGGVNDDSYLDIRIGHVVVKTIQVGRVGEYVVPKGISGFRKKTIPEQTRGGISLSIY